MDGGKEVIMAKEKKIVVRPKKLTLVAPAIESDHIDYYKSDFLKWTEEQTRLLKKGDYSHLDIDNLIEEIQSLGKQERERLESQLRNILMHLLKCKYQPQKKTNSWDLSIKASRYTAQKVFKQNPSLKPELDSILHDAYYVARLDAASETGLPEKTFPVKCPWKVDEVLCMETAPKMAHKPKKAKGK